MKTLRIALTGLLIIGCLFSYAQPQWKFHIAYEDATGAKDTMWFIWDESATFLELILL